MADLTTARRLVARFRNATKEFVTAGGAPVVADEFVGRMEEVGESVGWRVVRVFG